MADFPVPCGVPSRSADDEQVVAPSTVMTPPVSFGEGETQSRTPSANRSRPAALLAGTEFGDYELLAEIARGGMGVVFKARQKSLRRVVALKMILTGQLAGPEEVFRFRAEAEAAANLDHSGIVPVYEVGEEAGQHYFSMGYVEGQSLARRVADGPLPPREASELVKRIAEAIDYAHGKGVIHRDLKPGNVLLDSAGQVRVTDFGLAKRIGGDESGLTATGQVMGTPSYMPPEQAQGKLDQIDARSDVYSLGAILYCLLTGRPPFQAASTLETLKQVVEQEPVSPRQLNPQVPRDLETIALKCLEKEQPRRYASAQDIADELGRYLRDEPIAARPVGRAARLWRWCRRNKAVAALAASVAVVLIAGIAVSSTLAVIASSNARLAMDRADVIEDKNTELTKANEREREAATAAREQTQLALNSLQSVIFDIARKLENVPGVSGLRRSLLETALSRLAEVSERYAATGAVDRTTASALNDLGDVLLRFSSAANEDKIVGGRSLTAARHAYERAFEIIHDLAAADPSDAQAQRELAVAYERLGTVQRQAGQVSDALGSYLNMFEISQKLAAAHPSNVPLSRTLIASYVGLGDVQLQSGQVSDALDWYRKSFEISQKLAAADPSDAQAQRDLCVSHTRLGKVQSQCGQWSEAIDSYRNSMEILQKLAAADPSDAEAQRDLSISYVSLADAQSSIGELSEALGSYRKYFEISQKLAAADPSDAQAQRDLFISYERLGDVQLQSGQVSDALGSYQNMLEISQKLAAADMSDAVAQRDLSGAYKKLGDVQLKSGQVNEALESYRKTMEIRQKLAAADTSDSTAQRDLSLSFQLFGDAQFDSGQVSESLDSYRKSLEISQKLAAADPSDAYAQFLLYESLAAFALAEDTVKRYRPAIDWYEEALDVLMRLDSTDRLPATHKAKIGLIRRRIQECKLNEIALGDWPSLLAQPTDGLPALLDFRGRMLIRDGRTQDAAQAAAKLCELDNVTAKQLYNAACVLSLCAAAGNKPQPEPLDAQSPRESEPSLGSDHIATALAALRAAIAAGFSDFDHMATDPDLAPLRETQEFMELAKPR